MVPIQKNVFFLVSVLLLLQNGAFSMENKKESLFSRLFKKKPIDSKENKGNVSGNQLNKRPPNSKEDYKLADMKEIVLKKKEDLEGWVFLDDKEDKELMNGWGNIDNESSEEYVTYDPIDSNDEKLIERINVEKTKKIIELFENF